MPTNPPANVLEMPKSVPAKFGAKSMWLWKWPVVTAPLRNRLRHIRPQANWALQPVKVMSAMNIAAPYWDRVLKTLKLKFLFMKCSYFITALVNWPSQTQYWQPLPVETEISQPGEKDGAAVSAQLWQRCQKSGRFHIKAQHQFEIRWPVGTYGDQTKCISTIRRNQRPKGNWGQNVLPRHRKRFLHRNILPDRLCDPILLFLWNSEESIEQQNKKRSWIMSLALPRMIFRVVKDQKPPEHEPNDRAYAAGVKTVLPAELRSQVATPTEWPDL